MSDVPGPDDTEQDGARLPCRRRMLYLSTAAMGAAGLAAAAWPLIDTMNPAADTLASATVDVDISAVRPGQAITVAWQGRPVFVRHRTPAEIADLRAVPLAALKDPQDDAARVQRPEWLVVLGICTHLGCVPVADDGAGHIGGHGGWFCPCHGSRFDASGRVRQGPAPENLRVPRYSFVSDTLIRIG